MYYNCQGKMVKFNLQKPKYTGGTSEIFEQDNNILLKRYFHYIDNDYRLQYDMFKFLQKLNHPNVNYIIDIFYNEDEIKKIYNGTNISNYILENKEHLYIDAYKYNFLENINIELENQSTEYLIYNLNAIEELMNIFTENKILVFDLKYFNTIFNQDKIILIDLDCCNFAYNLKTDSLYINNMDELCSLFRDLFRQGRYENVPYFEEIYDLFYLSNKDLDNRKSLTELVSKKLKKCKTPLEYFKKSR